MTMTEIVRGRRADRSESPRCAFAGYGRAPPLSASSVMDVSSACIDARGEQAKKCTELLVCRAFAQQLRHASTGSATSLCHWSQARRLPEPGGASSRHDFAASLDAACKGSAWNECWEYCVAGRTSPSSWPYRRSAPCRGSHAVRMVPCNRCDGRATAATACGGGDRDRRRHDLNLRACGQRCQCDTAQHRRLA